MLDSAHVESLLKFTCIQRKHRKVSVERSVLASISFPSQSALRGALYRNLIWSQPGNSNGRKIARMVQWPRGNPREAAITESISSRDAKISDAIGDLWRETVTKNREPKIDFRIHFGGIFGGSSNSVLKLDLNYTLFPGSWWHYNGTDVIAYNTSVILIIVSGFADSDVLHTSNDGPGIMITFKF
jgi:hypothetical protein